MQTATYSPKRQQQTQSYWIERILLALLFGFVFFFISAAVLTAGFQIWYLGRIFPGVTAAGIEVGGMTPNQAAEKINQQLVYSINGKIALQYNDQTWITSPIELGLLLDANASAQTAYQIGRSGNLFNRLEDQFTAWYNKQDVSPNLILDERMTYRFLSGIAQKIDKPVIEPELGIKGTEVLIQQGQVGQTLDIPATIERLHTQLTSLQDGVVPIAMIETHPLVADVTQQAALAHQILSQPMILKLPDNTSDSVGPWILKPDAIAPMLAFERTQDQEQAFYQVAVSKSLLYAYLSEIAPKILQESRNARFIFNDDTHQLEILESSITGRRLDVEASVDKIQKELLNGGHEITLELVITPPSVTSEATAEQLGITGLIHAETSYYYGSNAARVQNIQASASRFHGLLVAPGETFSMAAALGDISLDNGYAEASIILGGRTIKGVGGGVCQVSTTLFRAAFFTGFPIVERYPHAYRVYYYEKVAGNIIDPDLAGLDATVFVPLVDFKFKNDSPNWLLMETYVNPSYSSITWKFYSTPDGRTVDWNTTGPVDIAEAPKPLYKENPDMPSGEVKQVDWAADGADVTVNRTVIRDGATYFQDTFKTHYEPWQAVFEYGPGTEGMPPEDNNDE